MENSLVGKVVFACSFSHNIAGHILVIYGSETSLVGIPLDRTQAPMWVIDVDGGEWDFLCPRDADLDLYNKLMNEMWDAKASGGANGLVASELYDLLKEMCVEYYSGKEEQEHLDQVIEAVADEFMPQLSQRIAELYKSDFEVTIQIRQA